MIVQTAVMMSPIQNSPLNERTVSPKKVLSDPEIPDDGAGLTRADAVVESGFCKQLTFSRISAITRLCTIGTITELYSAATISV